jgi:glyoxylase-like metal-dependent hydrolase (beta-lactamase superfamily II)
MLTKAGRRVNLRSDVTAGDHPDDVITLVFWEVSSQTWPVLASTPKTVELGHVSHRPHKLTASVLGSRIEGTGRAIPNPAKECCGNDRQGDPRAFSAACPLQPIPAAPGQAPPLFHAHHLPTKTTMKIDYNNPVAATREIYWVGFYDDKARLHCNPYLILDEEDIVFIDPGSIPHFPVVMRKVMELVNPEDITYVIAHHQDPDVCGNLAVVEDVINRNDLKILAHSNTIRLIRHLGLRSEFVAVDEQEYAVTLKSGRRLEFIFTPYLHSPGAIVTYDTRTRSLFTSDIFAAISQDWTLFAEGDFLTPMEPFHQRYMPSNAILRRALERFEGMDLERVLPQHGSILEGRDIQRAIDHLKQLPCGVDLIEDGAGQ